MSDVPISAKPPVRRLVLGWVLVGAGLLSLAAACVGLLVALDQRRPATVRAAELMYLPKGKYLKVAAIGYEQVVADLIWLKAVQHFGERGQTAEGFRWAYHAVDVVTDMDPKFTVAYQVAGTILGVWAGLLQESLTILKKGMHHNPDVWQLPFLIGYDYFYELCDQAQAAEYLRIASLLPGAPEYLPKLAARMTVEAGDPDAALEFLGRFQQQVNDERIRESIAHRIKEVIAERDIRFLEEGVRRYQAGYHKRPATLRDLVTGGIIAQIPDEPLGGAYLLRPSDGTVTSTGLQERLRIHVRVNPHIPCHLERYGSG